MRSKTKISKGRWRLECERFHLPLDTEIPGNDDCMAVGLAIEPLLKKLGLQDAAVANKIFESWSAAVGPDVAKHARPISLQAGVLTVNVDSSVWLSELSRYSGKKIMEKLSKISGVSGIKKISFRMDPGKANP